MNRSHVQPLGELLTVVIIALLLLSTTLGACSKDDGGDGVNGTTLTETTLEDGTPCVVAKTSQGVALTCAWSQP